MFFAWRNAKSIVPDAVEGPHEDHHGKRTSDDRNGEEEREHDCTHGRLSARLESPRQISIVDKKRPGDTMRRWCSQVECVESGGIGRKTIHDTIAIKVSVVKVVIRKHIELHGSGPGRHNFEFI